MLSLSLLLIFAAFGIFFYNILYYIKRRYDYLIDANPDAVKGKIAFSSITTWDGARKRALGIVMALFGVLIGLQMHLGIAGPLGGAVLLGFGPIVFLNIRQKAAKQKLQDQLVQMLNLLSSSMRSGKTLPQAVTEVSETIGGPIGQELKLATRQILVGIKVDSALQMFQQRIDVPEVSLAIKAMIISIGTGADLPAAMLNIANTITARDRLERKIRAMTAQGRVQAVIMGLAPFLMLGIFYMLSPGYYNVMFTTTVGNIVLGAIILLQVIAFLTINQIIKVKI